jgi:protein-disulfide isomerase
MHTGELSRRVVGVLVMLAVVLVGAGAGQTTPQKPAPKLKTADEVKELKKEVRELQEGQEAIRKELRELRELLKKGPPAPTTVSIGGRPFRGNENARLVIVEFSDYQCPYCGLFFREALPQLEREYIQSGKIKYVFSNLPLDDIHPLAFKASQAAECAREQDKFWELHDWMFANQKKLGQVEVAAQAKTLGLDMTKFNQCLAGDKAAALVRANAEEAESLGIDGTPSFVLGLIDAKNPGDTNIKIVGILSGAQPFSVFKTAIEKALAMKQ